MMLTGSSLLLGARIARTVLMLLGMTVLARLLTPSDFGVVALAGSLNVLALSIVEGLSDYPIARQDDLSRDSLRLLFWISMGLICAVMAVAWVVAPLIERWMQFPRLALGLRAMVPVCIAQVAWVIGNALLRRSHRYRTAASISIITVVVYLVIGIGLAIAGWGVWSVLLGQICAQAITALVIIRASGMPLGFPVNWNNPELMAVGRWGAFSRILNWGWTNIDTVATSLYLGPAATGIYSRAYNINTQAREPFHAIDQTIRQAFSVMKNRDSGFSDQALMALRMLTILSGYVAASLFVLRDLVVGILLGGQWGDTSLPLAILAAGLPARIALLFYDSLSITTGTMRGLATRQIVTLSVMAVGLASLAPRGVEWVAAVVTAASYVSLCALPLINRSAAGGSAGLAARALLPGIGILAGAVICVEGICARLIPGPWLHLEWLIRTVLIGAIGAALFLLLPNRWLGHAISAIRYRIVHLLWGAIPHIFRKKTGRS